jgi:hypothetical protein
LKAKKRGTDCADSAKLKPGERDGLDLREVRRLIDKP